MRHDDPCVRGDIHSTDRTANSTRVKAGWLAGWLACSLLAIWTYTNTGTLIKQKTHNRGKRKPSKTKQKTKQNKTNKRIIKYIKQLNECRLTATKS